MTDEPIIHTKDLTKSYGPHVALDNLNISIPPGATGLLGQNGAGKSGGQTTSDILFKNTKMPEIV